MKKWHLPIEMYGLPVKIHRAKGQTFYTTYKEHIQAIKSNNGNSGYLNNILSTGHTYGSITNTMNIIKREKIRKLPSTLENYHIYKISGSRLHINDTHTDVYNTTKLK
jgi:hypothetical protein